MNEEIIKNGLIGKYGGYRLNGLSFDAENNPIDEVHDDDCFCCRASLLKHNDKKRS